MQLLPQTGCSLPFEPLLSLRALPAVLGFPVTLKHLLSTYHLSVVLLDADSAVMGNTDEVLAF